MNVKNCRKCGRVFNYITGDQICPQCREKMEEIFQNVKQYVQDHKKATVNEICEDCDVDQKQIRQWIREERLVFSDDSPVKINCENCGTQINTGRFCAKCKKETMNVFQSASRSMERPTMPAENSRSGSKMYTRS